MWLLEVFLMTYFGVNFYLSGLHSYASGDQILSVPIYCCIALGIIAIIAFLAYRKYRGLPQVT